MKKISHLFGVASLALAASLSPAVNAEMNVVVESYDHMDPEFCDGLFLNGVTYGFTVDGIPSQSCRAGVLGGPGSTNNNEPPNILGYSAGVLYLSFDTPTTVFGFGVTQSRMGGQNDVTINLNRPGAGVLRETVVLETNPDPRWVGGYYYYDGPAVKTVTISFSNIGGQFALDNLEYFMPPGRGNKVDRVK